jgi:hypothetical protein
MPKDVGRRDGALVLLIEEAAPFVRARWMPLQAGGFVIRLRSRRDRWN